MSKVDLWCITFHCSYNMVYFSLMFWGNLIPPLDHEKITFGAPDAMHTSLAVLPICAAALDRASDLSIAGLSERKIAKVPISIKNYQSIVNNYFPQWIVGITNFFIEEW